MSGSDQPQGLILDSSPGGGSGQPEGLVLDAPAGASGAQPVGLVLDPPLTPAGNPRPDPLPLPLEDTPANAPAAGAPATTQPPVSYAASVGQATGPDGSQPAGAGMTVRPNLGLDTGAFLPGVRVPGQGAAGAAGNALGQGLAQGVAGVVSGTGTAIGMGMNASQRQAMSAMDRIDAGQPVPDADDPYGYQQMTPQQRSDLRAQLTALPGAGTQAGMPLLQGAQAAGDAINQTAQAALPVDSRQEGFTTGLARGAGGLAPIVAAGLTPAAAALVPTMIGAQSFDSTFREAKARGASDEDAFSAASVNGAVQAGLMSLPLSGAILGVANPALRDGLLKTALNLTAHGVGFESAAEAGRFADNYVAQQTYDPQRKLGEGLGDQLAQNLALSLVVPAGHAATELPSLYRAVTAPRIDASPALRQGAAGMVEAAQELRSAAAPAESTPVAQPAPAAASPESTQDPSVVASDAGSAASPDNDLPTASAESTPAATAPADVPPPQGFVLDPEPVAAAASLRAGPPSPDTIAPGAPLATRQSAVEQRLMQDLGLPLTGASGITGLLTAESGITAVNEQHPLIPGSRGGFGWAQWTGPRRVAFEAFAKARGADVTDPETNYQFLLQELQQPAYAGMLDQLRNAASPQEAARIAFPFESGGDPRAKFGNRADLAAQAYDAFKPPLEGQAVGQPMLSFTNGGASVEVQPMLVDLASLTTSHDDDGRVNPLYPHADGLQPRDRSNAASQAQVQELAGNLQPERLAPSAEAATGAPIVGPDGVVESGNGRTMALRRVYTDPNLAPQRDAYRGWLDSQGLDTSGMAQPVLVSQRLTPLDAGQRTDFARDANERSTLGMNAAEQARADASRIGRSIELWQGSDAGAAANAPFVRDVMGQMSPEERGGMMLPDGTLSATGERRIQSAVTSYAYGDQLGPTLERFINGDDAGTKAVAGALSDTAGAWAQMRAAAAAGEIPPSLDITPDLASAVQTLSRARQLGRPVAELVNQTDFDRPPLSAPATALLVSMFRDKGLRQAAGRDRVASTLKDYAAEAMRQTAGQDMFGAPPPSPLAVLEATRRGDDGMASKARLLSLRESRQSARHAADAPDARTALPQAQAARQRLFDAAQAMMRYMGLPPEVGLKFVDRLIDAATKKVADGTYESNLITFALDTDPHDVPFRMFHEIVHGLMDPKLGLLSDGQRDAMYAAADRWLAKDGNRARLAKSYDVDPKSAKGKQVLRDEAVAQMGEEALARGITARGSAGWIADRMNNFVRGVGGLLRGRGFRTADDVFRHLMQGRRALEGSREALLAARPHNELHAMFAANGLPPSLMLEQGPWAPRWTAPEPGAAPTDQNDPSSRIEASASGAAAITGGDGPRTQSDATVTAREVPSTEAGRQLAAMLPEQRGRYFKPEDFYRNKGVPPPEEPERQYSLRDTRPDLGDFKGDYVAAGQALEQQQGGVARDALYNAEVGPIDLVWGQAGTNQSNGFGLAKLIAWHPEVVSDLPERIAAMHVIDKSTNRVRLASDTSAAAVRLDWDGNDRRWLLTAYATDVPRRAERSTDSLDTLLAKRLAPRSGLGGGILAPTGDQSNDPWQRLRATSEVAAGQQRPLQSSSSKASAAGIISSDQGEGGISPPEGGDKQFSLRDAPEAARFAQKVADLPGFYSAVARTAALLKQERGSGQQFAAAIRNAAGVKPEELKWLGLEAWLRNQPSVTKQQVMDFVAANNLHIQEVTLGESAGGMDAVDAAEDRLRGALAQTLGLEAYDPAVGRRMLDLLTDPVAARDSPADVRSALAAYEQAGRDAEGTLDTATRFEDYQVAGGDNYREVLLTLPRRERSPVKPHGRIEALMNGKFRLDTPGGQPELFATRAAAESRARDLGEPGTPDTNNFQSTHWTEPNVVAHLRLNDRIEPDGKRVLFVEEVQSDWHQAGRDRGYQGDVSAGAEAVPDAPFRTSWPALAMKRVLRMAAEDGFDRVAWTTGDTQADRYDLSKKAISVHWNESTGELDARGMDGRRFTVSDSVDRDNLAQHVGKDVAAKLLAQEPGVFGLRGADLPDGAKLGGAGMRGFYDRMLPTEVAKIVRPFGGEVARGSIDLSGDDRPGAPPTVAVHQVEMTPHLRSAALEDGFPLFSLRDRGQKLVASADERRKGLSGVLRRTFAPITEGAKEARLAAARFANAMHDAHYTYGRIDRWLLQTFDHPTLEKMWNALDEQSLFEIELKEGLAAARPVERGQLEAQARDAFKEHGLGSLTPEQREVVTQLSDLAKLTWYRMQQRGLVNPKAEGLPYWAPRFFVRTQDGKTVVATDPTKMAGRSRAIDPLGMNLSTRRPWDREIRITADSIKAMKAKYGDDTELVRNIRTVPLALSKEERAIAGKDLVDAIKDFTIKNGATGGTVAITAQPNSWETADYVEINHPSLLEPVAKTRTMDDGSVQVVRDAITGDPVMTTRIMRVHKDFEHPLRAVLTSPQGDFYKAAMTLKGRATSMIMFSPMMHLAVEVGRAFPAMPGMVVSLRWLRQGSALRADRAFMSDAIRNGSLRMVGGTWMQDITGIYDEPNIAPGRSFLAKALGAMGDTRDKDFGNRIRRAVDRAGEFWHQYLLWDRVADLQVTIYRDMRAKYIAAGDPEGVAALKAGHLANRYAGSLPKEALSNFANKAANLGMFSRSFTLGNLGVLKDMFNGMPDYVRVQIEAQAGLHTPDGLKLADKAAKSLRRKAWAAVALDVGLYYLTNSMLQNVFQLWAGPQHGGQSLDQVAQGYVRRVHDELQRLASRPWEILNPFGVIQSLTPNSENEFGKQNRIWYGNRADGTGIYLRSPMGKIGEEFMGWLATPAAMARNKESTLIRPVWEVITNRDGLDHQIMNPDPDGMLGALHNVGRMVLHILGEQAPVGLAQDAGTIVRRGVIDPAIAAVSGAAPPQTDKEKAKAALHGKDLSDALMQTVPSFLPPPFTFQISHGYPGGPEAGFEAAAQRGQQFNREDVAPQARRLLTGGDEDAARTLLQGAGLTPQQINGFVRSAVNPARNQVRMGRLFQRSATPEQQEQLQHVTGARSGLAAASPIDPMQQAAATGIAQAQQMARGLSGR